MDGVRSRANVYYFFFIHILHENGVGIYTIQLFVYCLNLDRSRIHPIKNSYVQGIEHEIRSKFKNKWIARCSWTWWVLFFKIIFLNNFFNSFKNIFDINIYFKKKFRMKFQTDSMNYEVYELKHKLHLF